MLCWLALHSTLSAVKFWSTTRPPHRRPPPLLSLTSSLTGSTCGYADMHFNDRSWAPGWVLYR